MDDSEKVDKLANHLLNSGIAMSESHAKKMASDISSTGSKVEKDFNDKKEEATMSSNKYRDDNVRRMRENAQKGKPVDVQVDYDMPGIGKDATVQDLVGAQDREAEEEEIVSDEPESDVDIGDVFDFNS